MAAAVSMALLRFAPPGVDTAAHVYQTDLAARLGVVVWDNRWYEGRFSWFTYSPLYYPLSAWIGMWPLAVASGAVGAWATVAFVQAAFGRVARGLGAAAGVAWGAFVLSAAYPFALGAAFGAMALASAAPWLAPTRASLGTGPVEVEATHRSGRWVRGIGFCVAALACGGASALALLGLATAVAAFSLGRGIRRNPTLWLLAVVAVLVAAEVAWMRAFPDFGRYPFWWPDLVEVEAFAAALAAMTWRVRGAEPIFGGAALYAAIGLVAFVVPSDLGANVARVRYGAVVLALVVCALRRWRPVWACVGVLCGALAWNAAPLVGAWVAAPNPPDAPKAYWAPGVAYLRGHLAPSDRVEAVDTVDHWPAARLAEAGIPLVRGWFRQDDFPANALLYRSGPLRPREYLRWLRAQGAGYVVLSAAPPDFSSRAEAALLRSGRSGLTKVFSDGHLSIYRVPLPRPILEGPNSPQVLRMGTTSVVLSLKSAGDYRLRIHYDPYWEPSSGCVSRSGDGMTLVTVSSGRLVLLAQRVDVGRVISVITGSFGQRCAHMGVGPALHVGPRAGSVA